MGFNDGSPVMFTMFEFLTRTCELMHLLIMYEYAELQKGKF